MNKNNSKFSWGLISKNRAVIYGLSIVWIILFHSQPIESNSFRVYNEFKNIGNIGVDIFLFVSGISLYFSFTKGDNILLFYKRRFRRIAIPALIVGIPYFFGRDVILYKLGINTFLMNLTGISLFTDRIKTVWFVTAIVFFYLLYPVIYKYYEKCRWNIYSLFILQALVIATFVVIRGNFPEFWHNSEILFRRFPIFATGAYFGRTVFMDKATNCPKWVIIVCGVISVITVLNLHMYVVNPIISYRYIFGMAAVPITAFFSLIDSSNEIGKMAISMAPYTFEIYLLNEKTANMVVRIIKRLNLATGVSLIITINVLTIIVTIILAIVLKKIEESFFKKHVSTSVCSRIFERSK